MAATKINTGYIQDLVNDYKKNESSKTEIVDIITFAESNWGLNYTFYPMQKLILKAFYGLELDDTKEYIPLRDEMNEKTLGMFTEKGMMDWLIESNRTNIKEYDPNQPKRWYILCCGRRASKTSMTAVICAYEVYRMIKLGNPQRYFGFPEGDEIDITCVAAVDEQALPIYNKIYNLISSCRFFNGRIDADTKVFLSLKTDADIEAGRSGSIQINCAGAGSRALRSKNNLIVVLDEAAHYTNVGPGSLEQCLKAVEPSTSSFVPFGKSVGEGKVIMLSTPLAKSGLFYNKCADAFDDPTYTMLFQMYSSMINLKMDQIELKQSKKKDKEKFRCEYLAEFSDTISGWCSSDVIEKSINKSRKENRIKGDPGTAYFMGIDFGGKNDGTSLAICHKEDDVIVLDVADVFYSSSSDVWNSDMKFYQFCNHMFADQDVIPLNKFADHIADLCSKFNVVEGWFDQYNGYGLLELLKERKLNQFEMRVVTAALNLQTYQITKELLNSEKLLLFDHPVLIPELASLEERRSGAVMAVKAPDRSGFHDDISDAVARCVYCAYHSKKSSGRKMSAGIGDINNNYSFASYRKFQLERARQFGGQEYWDHMRGLDKIWR